MKRDILNVGFSGTRKGMTEAQASVLRKHLVQLASEWVVIFHHGDCVGSDAEAHDIAADLGLWIVGHPPTDVKEQAFKDCDELRPRRPYIKRNHDIVNETDILFATPGGPEKVRGSGTWATIRYAQRTHAHYTMILRDGRTLRRTS
jgi:hypothetical protein